MMKTMLSVVPLLGFVV